MQRTAFAAVLVLALTACGHGEKPADSATAAAPAAPASVAKPAAPAVAAAPALDRSQERDALNAWLDAWNAHDEQRLATMLDDKVEFFDSGFAGLQHGRDAAMEKGVGVFIRGVPDLHWELRGEPIVGQDAIAWEWTLTGTHTGTWGGVPATRQRIQLKGVGLMRLHEGRIVEVAMYYDSVSLNRQLGL